MPQHVPRRYADMMLSKPSPALGATPTASGSAFRAKGLIYRNSRAFCDERVSGGFAAVVAAIESPDLRAFIVQPFVVGGWYGILPILPISVAAARLAGMPLPAFVRENARWVARRDLSGPYRVLLSLASVRVLAERLPKLSMRYFDFGSVDGRMIGERKLESVRSGIPAPLAQWFIWCVEGFVPEALGLVKGNGVRVRAFTPSIDGEAHGVRTTRLRFEISWD